MQQIWNRINELKLHGMKYPGGTIPRNFKEFKETNAANRSAMLKKVRSIENQRQLAAAR